MNKVLVIGVGNILVSDEGVGVAVVRKLMDEKLPAGVEVIDAGCALADTLIHFEGISKAIIIDAVKGGGNPGDIYRFDIDALKGKTKRPGFSASLHDIGLQESIGLAELSGWEPPEIIIIGVEPEKLELGMEMSDTIKAKVPAIIDVVLGEIGRPTENGD